MTSFWLYSIPLVALALLFIVVPVLRFKSIVKKADSDIRKEKNIEVFKESLAELERDLAEKSISDEEFARLKTELQRSFMRDMEEKESTTRQRAEGAAPKKLVPLLCILFVPLFSISIYTSIGSARDLALPGILASLSTAETAEAQQEALVSLAEFLQQRFDRNDDDIQNGYMLGTLYIELEEFTKAIPIFTAMAEQMEESPDKAAVLGQLAQSLYLEADSEITQEVSAAINEALSMNPNEYAVMSILAIESFVNQDFRQAVFYWRRQLAQLDSNSQQAFSLRDRIARVESLLPPEPESEESEETGEPGAAVSMIVDVDDSVRELIDESMRLFIYARSPEFPMPLAAVNLAQPEFPFEITLTDDNAMVPVAKLSLATQVYVGARLSREGVANAQAGDIQAESATFVLEEQDGIISLTIKDIVQ